MHLNKLEDAEKNYKKAIHYNSNLYTAYSNLGYLYASKLN